MPRAGCLWYQIILNTRCTWLHGDPRGFRTRNKRIQSSGDYRNPPPVDEHAGLRRHFERHSGPPVRIPAHLLPVIGERLIAKIQSQGRHVLVASVDSVHAHLLVELPNHRSRIKRIVGTWKQAASHAVRGEMPGHLWAEDCNPEPIRDAKHHVNTFNYILRHGTKGAWVWRFDRVD